jgi:hypothetical protein
LFHQAAQFKIGGIYAVSVEQNDGRPFSRFDIVQAHTVHIDELALRRMQAFGLALLGLHVQQRGQQAGDADQRRRLQTAWGRDD